MTNASYSIRSGETLFDVTNKLYGSLESYVKLLIDNSENLILGYGKGIVPISVTNAVDLNDEWIPNPSSDAVFNPGVSFVFMGGNDSDDFVTLSPTNVPALFYTANEYIINWNVNFSDLLNQTLFIELVFENSVSVTETTTQGTGTAIVLQDPSWGALIEVAVGIHGDHSESVTVTSFSITGINTVSINEAIYDNTIKTTVLQPLIVNTPPIILAQKYIARQSQTIFDIALMLQGNLESLVSLVIDSGIERLENIQFGDEFTYMVANNIVTNWVQGSGFVFATGTTITEGVKGFLEQQNEFYILQQSGFKIILT